MACEDGLVAVFSLFLSHFLLGCLDGFADDYAWK